MRKNIGFFCGLFAVGLMTGGVLAAQNVSRSAVNMEHARASGTVAAPRTRAVTTVTRGDNSTRAERNVSARTTAVSRSSTPSFDRANNVIRDAGRVIMRRVFGMGRDTATNTPVARVAKNMPGTARSAVVSGGASRSRATAVFSDTSKMGEGYNNCRTSYNTCMDQICAVANDTYRRCFCSDTFRDLRDKEEALDAATQMLARFEDSNLSAVNKTAEEVNAMYSATAGEMAIKKDTSAAAALLDDISDLLSGKTKAQQQTTPLNPLDSLDFSADLGDIWSTNSSDSIFGGASGGVDLTKLEGTELYNNANKQCMQVIGDNCESAAIKNMAKSTYSILIAQDCNAYKAKLETKTEQVKKTVRTAEKYLREARLEEYRFHNSADVNECLDAVEKAILSNSACGADYMKCLDYTGAYINTSTGEPIYSPQLFRLDELILLNGTSADVLAQNPDFDKFLDTKRIHAAAALDTCRSIADTVWSEFKRNALIKIAQAQDEKIEEVKMSCVSTMKECYDSQSDALKSFDDTTAQASGALAARASRDMCVDKVAACAALYGGVKCNIDSKTGKVTNADKCGLASLRNFVNTVDDVRIAEGCGTAVENYLKQLCTPTIGDKGYPWNCRLIAFGNVPATSNGWNKSNNKDLVSMVTKYAIENCVGTDATQLTESRIISQVTQQLDVLRESLEYQLGAACTEIDGLWVNSGANMTRVQQNGVNVLTSFYANVFGGRESNNEKSLGVCYENTTMTACLSYNTDSEKDGDMATYDAARDECVFKDAWYEKKCALLGNGYFENGVCYVAQ